MKVGQALKLVRNLESLDEGKKASVAPGPRVVAAALKAVDPDSLLSHQERTTQARALLGEVNTSDIPDHIADSLNEASLEQARQTLDMVARVAPEVDAALSAATGRSGAFDLSKVQRTFAREVAPLANQAGEIGNWLTHHLWVVENAGSTEHGERSNAPKRRPWVVDRTMVEELKSKSPADGAALEATVHKNNAGQIARNLKFATLFVEGTAKAPGLHETGESYLQAVRELDATDPFQGASASHGRLSDDTASYLFSLLDQLVALKRMPDSASSEEVAKKAPQAFQWLGDIVHTAFVAQRLGSAEGISEHQAVPFSRLGSGTSDKVDRDAQWKEIRYDVDAAIGTLYGLLKAGGRLEAAGTP